MVAMIAHSANEPDQAETAEANAQLIAAAPELLEALTYILSEYDAPNTLNDTTFRTARKAIAKAIGESGD
jgi:hypothetical protein